MRSMLFLIGKYIECYDKPKILPPYIRHLKDKSQSIRCLGNRLREEAGLKLHQIFHGTTSEIQKEAVAQVLETKSLRWNSDSHLVAIAPLVSAFIVLSLSFLICKLETVILHSRDFLQRLNDIVNAFSRELPTRFLHKEQWLPLLRLRGELRLLCMDHLSPDFFQLGNIELKQHDCLPLLKCLVKQLDIGVLTAWRWG